MQKAMLMLMAVLFTVVTNAQSLKTDSIKVYGNCGMCKKKIEGAIKADVKTANWNSETKQLVVTYDAAKISNDKIQEKVAAAGYDTEKKKADTKAYDKLPACCQYDRKP
jgi:copper chaperone CopZ